MVAQGIGQVVPPVLLRLHANPTLHRIVVHIDKIAPGFLVSVFGHAPEGSLEKRSFPMADLIVLPGKNGSDIPLKGREPALLVHRNASVDVIGHLAQLDDMDVVLPCIRAEDGKIHQVVADAVKNDFALAGNLINVVDATTTESAISSPHGFLVPTLDLPAM